jgi:hypothetical protein
MRTDQMTVWSAVGEGGGTVMVMSGDESMNSRH